MTECQNEKCLFVQNSLRPLLVALDLGIKDAKYQIGATNEEVGYYFNPLPKGEYVVLTFTNNFQKGVDVTANSLVAICRDVLKGL